jgi:tetratricopeptide (TPR) repeat protein
LLVAFALLFVSPDGYVRAHRTISTSVPAAQAAFDDGLTLLYAYNPEQARRSFTNALALDPALAIGWWGVAMTYGPNINTAYDAGEAKNGHDAIAKARALVANASPVEVALIGAATSRFAHDGPKDGDRSADAYHEAMIAAAAQFPDDDDVQTLTAEAGMDRRPWGLDKDDGTPEPGTQDIVNRLQLVLARDPGHIGAEHFLIHAVEASTHPELALDAARRLASDRFEPGAEHLIHMPAHTFERVGEYHEAGEANARAVDAFVAYLGDEASTAHNGYLGHDCLFGVDAFMMSGEAARARALAQTCAAHDVGTSLPRIVAWRFHDWNALTTQGASAFVTAMMEIRAGDLASARKRASELNTQSDSTTAQIESAVISASIARARGETQTEIAALTHAVELEDGAGYQEPPAFWYPVRESLGAVELETSHARESAEIFRADLAKNPNNPRSLFGLAAALDRIGDTAGADSARKRFAQAWSHADVTLTVEDL